MRLVKYGCDNDTYVRLLTEQDYKCAICGKEETAKAARADRTRTLAIDHNHTTGTLRRLLCGNCNTAIGLMKDSPYLLEAAAAYLRSYANAQSW